MKKLILTISLLTLIVNISFSQPGWFWQNPLPQGNHLRDVKFINTTTGWAVGDYGTIIRTTNGGTNWILQSSGTTNDLFGVSFIDANIGTAVGDYGTIIRTTNGGTNWTGQISGTYRTLEDVSFTDANNGTAVGDYGTIRRTTNGGIIWTGQISGTTWTLEDVSFTDANTGTAVGWGGTILRTTNGGVIFINQISSKIPEGFSLYQNYPNPFNPITNIRFEISRTSIVKLIVYDILGREVSTLVNEKLNAGSYEVSWNSAGYPSGVYFYRLITDDFFDVKKMLLIK